MSKILLKTHTRIELQKIQKKYIQKYTDSSDFLKQEENYITDCLNIFFNDLATYFGEELLMFDGYYLSEDKKIKSINLNLKINNSNYKTLSGRFNEQYTEIFTSIKEKLNEDENCIISISHELIEYNEQTGFCFFKTEDKTSILYKPEDCIFVDLNRFEATNIKSTPIDIEKLVTLKNDFPEYEEFINVVNKLKINDYKIDGLARTFELYNYLSYKYKESYIYFIRPRIAHGEYNGTLVLFVSRELSSMEFDIISSFLNEILCQLTVSYQIQKEKQNLLGDYNLVQWGWEATTAEEKSIKISLSKILAKFEEEFKIDNEEINEIVLKAVDEFADFCENQIEGKSLSVSARVFQTALKSREGHDLNDSEFKARFKDTLIIRRVILLSCIYRDNNLIKFEKKISFLSNNLPHFILKTFKAGLFDLSIYSSQKRGDTSTYRKNLNCLGLDSNNTDRKLGVRTSVPHISKSEALWLERTKSNRTKQ
jgi:hypothetical protein